MIVASGSVSSELLSRSLPVLLNRAPAPAPSLLVKIPSFLTKLLARTYVDVSQCMLLGWLRFIQMMNMFKNGKEELGRSRVRNLGNSSGPKQDDEGQGREGTKFVLIPGAKHT